MNELSLTDLKYCTVHLMCCGFLKIQKQILDFLNNLFLFTIFRLNLNIYSYCKWNNILRLSYAIFYLIIF